MNGNRQKGAWIWVAMVAIGFASLARVQSGVENARAYADPVIKLFAAGAQADSDASVRAHHASSLTRAGAYGIDLNLLAVFFVGLVAPLTFQSVPAGSCIKRTPAGPFFSALFQRPPPFSLA
jgi:hypothetical protein